MCITTFQRPNGLRRLLSSLARLETRLARERLLIVIVDNDATTSATPIVAASEPQLPGRVLLVHEPQRGIPLARNRAVAAVPDSVEYVVWLDDDQEVTPGFLDALLDVQAATGADLVGGPVEPRYAASPPDWIVHGRFFGKQRHPTGARLRRVFTPNLLVRRAVLTALDPPFDERLRFSGGSDALFCERARRHGFVLTWADHALTYEHVPASRLTLRWLLQRAYRIGVMRATITRLVRGSAAAWVYALGVGSARVLLDGLGLVLLGPWRRKWGARRLRGLSYAAGLLAGALGWRYAEYRVVHGS